ncbi:MAG: hypothetical protein JWQ81_5302 [Amycolatopsis sp.]|jgi:hypothetical protein|uniref:DUF6294 family protein n=1 Tax=Amycolatopsis sp. TaxID=37632 RepID=UPI0026231A0E|nr:DUF6294 family protein [Amycolatopsis sp.]MCU1684563.1 hypothetical protein [Amycolatopsis sp.]
MKLKVRSLKPALAIAAIGTALLAAAPAAQAAPQNAVRTLEVRSATWGQLHSGDCQQDNGTIVLHSDGTGDWSADTLTRHTHSGDVWHTNLDFYTTAGFHLFSAGEFNSPRMNDGNPPPRYHWAAHFVFDPAEFNGVDIFRTLQRYSC